MNNFNRISEKPIATMLQSGFATRVTSNDGKCKHIKTFVDDRLTYFWVGSQSVGFAQLLANRLKSYHAKPESEVSLQIITNTILAVIGKRMVTSKRWPHKTASAPSSEGRKEPGLHRTHRRHQLPQDRRVESCSIKKPKTPV